MSTNSKFSGFDLKNVIAFSQKLLRGNFKVNLFSILVFADFDVTLMFQQIKFLFGLIRGPHLLAS